MGKYFLNYCKLATYALLSLLTFAACNSSSTTHNKLIVGLESSYPPFEFIDKNGDLVGFDLDIANEIAKELNKELVIKTMEFDGLILSLKQGQIDLIISGFNITPDRLKEINLVPYFGNDVSSFKLIFWNEIPTGITELNDLTTISDAVVCVEAGTVQETYLKNKSLINCRSLHGGSAQPLMDVKYGKSTAYLVDANVALFLQAQHPEIQMLDVPLTAEEKPLGCGIGIRKEDRGLKAQIERVMNMKSETLKELEMKWFIKGGQNDF